MACLNLLVIGLVLLDTSLFPLVRCYLQPSLSGTNTDYQIFGTTCCSIEPEAMESVPAILKKVTRTTTRRRTKSTSQVNMHSLSSLYSLSYLRAQYPVLVFSWCICVLMYNSYRYCRKLPESEELKMFRRSKQLLLPP